MGIKKELLYIVAQYIQIVNNAEMAKIWENITIYDHPRYRHI
jgi:hypothetical protein